MVEKHIKRLQNLITEIDAEELATLDAQFAADEAAKRLLKWGNRNVESEIEQLGSEINSLNDTTLKTKGKDYLFKKINELKELENEKKLRDDG
jgi:dephospho-CoA kinase